MRTYRTAPFSMTAVLMTAVCLLPTVVDAAVPHLIRYQGSLIDTQQVPLEGPYTLTFRLYDAATGGTNVWEETQTNVSLTKGQFSVLLGQVTPLDLAFDKDLWLSVEVNHDGEMSPRQQLSSVPYAYRAAVADVAQTAQNMKTSAIEDDGYRFVPSGVIVMVAGAICPAGYTRFAAVDNKFLVAGSAYNSSAGGSNTHSHAMTLNIPAHQHAFSTGGSTTSRNLNGGKQAGVSGGYIWPLEGGEGSTPALQDHTRVDGATTASGNASAADSRPEFATVLLCQKQ